MRALVRRPVVVVLALAVVAGGLALFLTAADLSHGLFIDTFSNTSNDFATDTLDSPTGLTATGGASISLSWTATADTYASGHRVFRSATSGGPYSQIAEVTPQTTTTYVDDPGGGTYFYVVRAFYQNWESANSNEASASTMISTGFLDCSSQAAVTVNAGDNDGYEVTPANACGDGGGFAQDIDSGTGAPNSCSSASKDRHLFYDYGFAIPAGSTINGIEVRLDAWADGTTSAPLMCVQLSWDGGSNWTAAKTTPTLGASEASFVLGSASDSWARTWSASELSNANFRVRVTDRSASSTRDFFLDRAAVEVTYTPP